MSQRYGQKDDGDGNQDVNDQIDIERPVCCLNIPFSDSNGNKPVGDGNHDGVGDGHQCNHAADDSEHAIVHNTQSLQREAGVQQSADRHDCQSDVHHDGVDGNGSVTVLLHRVLGLWTVPGRDNST